MKYSVKDNEQLGRRTTWQVKRFGTEQTQDILKREQGLRDFHKRKERQSTGNLNQKDEGGAGEKWWETEMCTWSLWKRVALFVSTVCLDKGF